jgi:NAD(P)-dependent dehydrogenase (short-subunit alcohol dehydrogenase family)
MRRARAGCWLTHALAISLGPEIRVNAVSPAGSMRVTPQRRAEPLTDADHAQHPAGRVGTVEDVAAMVAWLLSRQAGLSPARSSWSTAA